MSHKRVKLELDFIEAQKIPYLEDGRDPEKGLDCYGFLLWLYANAGYELPDIYSKKLETIPFMEYFKSYLGISVKIDDVYRHGDAIILFFPGAKNPHVAIVWDYESIIQFVDPYGFRKSPLRIYKPYIESTWRLNIEAYLHTKSS